eukprot:TRINITY_DN15786_c0_g1_i2.p1 TRINITY_DN15786_c0_g1~~TRINITY_DN15786_c0_g1_i2.p1  ORF type:complete len:447 (+),score=70.05 TRINITY_DN15786_c0_g1_i2:197-1537(+)
MDQRTPVASGRVVLKHYRLTAGPPLGTGGWCVVHRGEDIRTGRSVAVKTFGAQARRDWGEVALAHRFSREVHIFRSLGLGSSSKAHTGADGVGHNSMHHLVHLVDYSRQAGTDEPGPAEDGEYYTVLELADKALDVLMRLPSTSVLLERVRSVAVALAQGLSYLHMHGLVHLDVKPENVMDFGGVWKLIDLEGCLPKDGSVTVPMDNFTALYASPELARFALGETPAPRPSESMDMWAVGVVLLDILARTTAFQDTKSGFDSAALFEDVPPAIPNEAWYRWLAEEQPVAPLDFLEDGSDGAQLLASSQDLRDLLRRLLSKDAAQRPSAEDMLRHPLLRKQRSEDAPCRSAAASGHFDGAASKQAEFVKPDNQRAGVEEIFRRCLEDGASRAGVPRDRLPRVAVLLLLDRLGIGAKEAALVYNTLDPDGKAWIKYSELLDFVFGGER